MQNVCHCLQTPQLYKFARMYKCINASALLCLQLCVHVSRLCTAGVLRDEEESVSPLYLIEEMIGILMDHAEQSTSNAQADLFSNQEDAKKQRVNVNEVKQCCQWCSNYWSWVWCFCLSIFPRAFTKYGKNVRGPNEISHLFLRALYRLKIAFGLSGNTRLKK